MNKANWAYLPSNAPKKNILKKEALKAARRREENYRFKYGNGIEVINDRVVLKNNIVQTSDEMEALADARVRSISIDSSDKWSNIYTLLAHPVGAEVYLTNSKVGELFGAPKYYMHELGTDGTPDARIRFPYSIEAHKAAQTIAFQMAKYMMIKHNAASIIQRIFRVHKVRIEFRAYVQECYRAAKKIIYFYKKIKYRAQQVKKQHQKIYKAATICQHMVRTFIARRRIKQWSLRHRNRMVRKIQKWIRFILARKRQIRRMQRQYKNSSTRIIRNWRGYYVRLTLYRKKIAKYKILIRFRLYFRKKVDKYVRRIGRAMRKRRLYIKSRAIQCVIRCFLAERRLSKKRLEYLSNERKRLTVERSLLTQALLKSSLDFSWCGAQEIPGVIVAHMKKVDTLCTKILKGELYSKDNPATKDLTYKQRIVYATLFAFSARADNCIDYFSFKMALNYLSIKAKEPALIRESLLKIPMHNISSIVMADILEPKFTLLMRCNISGYMPDKLVIQAVLTRRWTKHLNFIVMNTILQFRRVNPPRRYCNKCFEPLVFDTDLFNHQTRCVRNHCYSWISRDAFVANELALINKCVHSLVDYPKLERGSKGKTTPTKADAAVTYLEEEDEDVDYLIDIIKSIEKKEAKAEADMKKKQEKQAAIEAKKNKNSTNQASPKKPNKPPPGAPPSRK